MPNEEQPLPTYLEIFRFCLRTLYNNRNLYLQTYKFKILLFKKCFLNTFKKNFVTLYFIVIRSLKTNRI